MRRSMKTVLAATAAVGLMAGQAAAESRESLEARVAALEEMLATLKAEMAAEKDGIIRLEARQEQIEVNASKAPANTGFLVGDTRVAFGGLIDLDAHVTDLTGGAIDSNSIARDFYIPGLTPVGGVDGDAFTDFTAQATRIYLTAQREVEGRTLSGRIEMDFLGSFQGDERVTNSFSPRLRLAYLDVDGWRFGQDWSTFQNVAAIPESASFLVLTDGMIFLRQPLIRYTRGGFQIALENPDTTVTTPSGARLDADANAIPDVVVRHNWKGAFGTASLAALGRQLKADTPGVAQDEAFGWGLSASGMIKLGARDDLRFNLVGGEGLGRYVGINAANGAIVAPDGSLEPLASYGGLLAWRHPFSDRTRVNIGWSGLFVDNPSFAAPGVTRQVMSAYAALLVDVAPRITIGGEAMFGERELESGASGEIRRLTFSSKYAF